MQKLLMEGVIPLTKANTMPIIRVAIVKNPIIERSAKKLESLVRRYLSKRKTQQASISHWVWDKFQGVDELYGPILEYDPSFNTILNNWKASIAISNIW